MKGSSAQLSFDFEELCDQAAQNSFVIQQTATLPAVQLVEEINAPIPEVPFEIPVWLMQWKNVTRGIAVWDDWSFQERTCKGWLLPYLYLIDSGFWGRWSYWAEALLEREWPKGDIPQISFGPSSKEAMVTLQKCLERFENQGVTLDDFQRWLLWGFGESMGSKERISDEVNEFWYRTFNLGPLIQHPHDYLGDIMSENKRGYWRNPNGFYPTPHNVVEMMVRMTMDRCQKTESVCDPALGTGRMLLHASNYSLKLYGMDIDRSCVMASITNGYLYAPWMVKPMPE